LLDGIGVDITAEFVASLVSGNQRSSSEGNLR